MTSTPIDHVRAPLFVPAARPERFGKALQSGADAVIIDLEDAVAASEKDRARALLRDQLTRLQPEVPVGIRTNGADTAHFAYDLELVSEIASSVDFITLPEVRSVEDVDRLIELAGDASALPLLALVENSQGLLNAPAIAAAAPVRRLALGMADLSNEWGVEPSPEGREFDVARQQLVIASRAAGLDGPLDSPHMNVRDAEGLTRHTAAVAQLGMKGRLCIHPQQVRPVVETFVVDTAEYERLVELITTFEQAEAGGSSSVRLDDGGFVDYPVYYRALRQVREYKRAHGTG